MENLDSTNPSSDEVVADEDESGHLANLIEQRRTKLDEWRSDGVDPYPVGIEISESLHSIAERYEGKLDAGEESDDVVTVAGRLVMRRGHGKLVFLVLRDDEDELQVMVSAKVIGEGMTTVSRYDVGDIITVTGRIIRSKRGELSVMATETGLVSKSLRPLPDKWHGLSDTDTRYRQRYVDLIVNKDSRAVFKLRSQVMQAIRTELTNRDFVEVETPILHPIPGGASAKPFVTHHNALDMDLYLRIAPELYLKRLIVGGFPKVFEIGRNFRNEGLSPRHNPEFMSVETYETYTDHNGVMELCEALVRRSAELACGRTKISYGGREVDLTTPFARRPLLDLAREATEVPELSYDSDIDDVRALCGRFKVPFKPTWGVQKLIVELYEKLVEGELWQPTFVTEHPVETSPLAHAHRDRPHVTERFELIVTGRELGNGFSELNDPDDQRARFESQAEEKAAGDEEAMVVDEDYLRALEYGMPPTGGLGIGIDRLVMLLADVETIRDVLFFPTLRPEAE